MLAVLAAHPLHVRFCGLLGTENLKIYPWTTESDLHTSYAPYWDSFHNQSMRNIRVAIVDDDQRVRAMFKRVFSRHGGVELVFQSATQSDMLAWITNHNGDNLPHVVLVDLGLPDGSGLDVIRAVKTYFPRAEAMVVSTFGDESKVLQSIAAGASGYLLKGQGDEDILTHIGHLMNGGSPMSPSIARRVLTRMRMSDLVTTLPSQRDLSDVEALSLREVELLKLLARGYSYEETAGEMKISVNTVRHHIKNIYSKLCVHTKHHAIQEAGRLGFLT